MKVIFIASCMFALGLIIGNKLNEGSANFFGAAIDGPVVLQLNGEMKCAWVKFNDTRKCRCHTNKYGWGSDYDKTFMISINSAMCEETIK